jgi:hypothetical protein
MKRDCPHCGQSMSGRFLRWSKIANVDRARNCPICNRDIALKTHPEEVAAQVLTAAAVIGAAYLAHERQGGYVAIVLTLALVLTTIYVAVFLLLRNRQRFKKRVF